MDNKEMKKHMMKMKICMKNMEKCMGDTENDKEEKDMNEEQD